MSDVIAYQRVCGIDVAKESLEAWIICGELKKNLAAANDAGGFAKIIELCQKHQVQIAVMEATGGYQRALALALVKAGIAVAVITPSRIRFYALSEGLIAKTDKVDAKIIAMYALKIAPKPTVVRSSLQEELACLVGRKAQLIDCKIAEENRLQQQAIPSALRGIKRHLKFLEKEIQKIDDQLDKLVCQDPELQSKAEVADAYKGIGRASAVALVVTMPELGTLTRRQAAALAGVAPFNKDSGKVNGPRHIFGGRVQVRSVLYMCILSAVRYDRKIRTFYEQLVTAGKCKMVALTACMRKLLVIVNARIREMMAGQRRHSPMAKEAAVAAAGG